MRKLILALMVVGLLLPITAQAETILYEKGDFKVSISKPTTCVLYDFKNDKVLGGGKISILQYKVLNGDIGLIGDEFNQDDIDFFVGISVDTEAFKINDNLYINVGLFGSPGWIDSKEERYGADAGLTYKW